MIEDDDMDGERGRRGTNWRLNKEINVSMLVVVIVQTLIAVSVVTSVYAAINNRIQRLEEKSVDDKATQAELLKLPERMLRNEFETAGVKTSINRLEVKIDQLSIDQARRDKQ